MSQHTTKTRVSEVGVLFAVLALLWSPVKATRGDDQCGEPCVIRTDGGRKTTVEPEVRTAMSRDREKWRELLNLITQETRAKLIQNVLGHPCMMPSLREMDHYNPSKTTGTLSEHLDKLVEAGVLMRVVIPQGERRGDLPNTFYTLTDEGHDLLDRHSLLIPHLEEIRDDHARVSKTEEVQRYEQAPRPTVNVDYPHPLQGDGRSVVDDPDCTEWEPEEETEHIASARKSD